MSQISGNYEAIESHPKCFFCHEVAERGALWHGEHSIAVCVGCTPKLGRIAADALHDLYNGAHAPDLRAAKLMLAKFEGEFYRALWSGQLRRPRPAEGIRERKDLA
jgi:hypothetical protein